MLLGVHLKGPLCNRRLSKVSILPPPPSPLCSPLAGLFWESCSLFTWSCSRITFHRPHPRQLGKLEAVVPHLLNHGFPYLIKELVVARPQVMASGSLPHPPRGHARGFTTMACPQGA